jgi:hypothetical protein
MCVLEDDLANCPFLKDCLITAEREGISSEEYYI